MDIANAIDNYIYNCYNTKAIGGINMNNDIDFESLDNEELVEILSVLEGMDDVIKEVGGSDEENND